MAGGRSGLGRWGRLGGFGFWVLGFGGGGGRGRRKREEGGVRWWEGREGGRGE